MIRLSHVVLILFVLLTSVAQLSGAVDTVTGMTFTITSGSVTITDGPDAISGTLTIPTFINGHPVVRIGRNAFSGFSTNDRRFTKLVIPHTVTEIEARAFSDCIRLEEIHFLGNAPRLLVNPTVNPYQSVYTEQFRGCSSLRSIIINGVDSWGQLESPTYPYAPQITNFQVYNGINPNFEDTDGDGIVDPYETNTGIYVSTTSTGTNPNQIDSDGDSLIDSCETMTGVYVSLSDTGTDPNKNDSDNDGLNDMQEILLNGVSFDPNTNSQISLESLSDIGFLRVEEIQDLRPGSTLIEVSGNQATVQFQMEESSNLESWTETGDTASITIPVQAEAGTKFFRFKMAD